MTVQQLRRDMAQAEYVHWAMYHARKAQRAELDQKLQAARTSARKR